MPKNSESVIVVYGGTGFIGSNFANYATRFGVRVIACGRSSRPNSRLNEKVDVVQMDATDLGTSRHFIHDVRPDAVVCCVSGIFPRSDIKVTLPEALTELRSLSNIIQCAHESGVQQLVFCSSGGAIYGDGQNAHNETDVCTPKSLYGELKLQAEMLARTLCGPLGIRAATLRIGNPYGPGQSPHGLHGVISAFLYKMLTGAPITIFGSLEAAKDYIFVDDVSAAIWASIKRQANGVFNIASGKPTSLRTLVEKISKVCSVEPDMKYVDLAATDVSTFSLDIMRATVGLQWKPIEDLDSGIALTKRWIEETYLR